MKRSLGEDRGTVSMEHENIKINIMRKAAEHCLADSYVSIRAFFKKIVEENNDMTVFVSRRCYLLFMMFAMIEGWSLDGICTDLGIYTNRKKLNGCNNVIVVDDIGYSGGSIRRVLQQVRRYTSKSCNILGVLYAVNRSSSDNILSIRKRSRGEDIKCRCQLTDRKCYEISVRFVSAILEAGMPYTVFLYPVWGKIRDSIDREYTLTPSANKMNLFKGYKWNTFYLNLEKVEKVSCINNISEYSCVRVYREPGNGKMEYYLPFIILKSVKADRVDDWCRFVVGVFNELGKTKLAGEIKTALDERKENKKDAMEYAAYIVSCFCSKAIEEALNLSKYLEVQKEGIDKSLKGSFSSEVYDALEACDAEFAELFLSKISEETGNAFYEESRKEYGGAVENIKNFVLQECMEKDAYETTYAIFEWLKKSYKTAYLDDMVLGLKETERFNLDDIYMAQIECWDMGIANYRLTFDPKCGIAGICSPGEMSAVIPVLKYQELIREYFRRMLEVDFEEENAEKQRENLEAVIRKASAEGKYTEKDIAEFREIVKKRNGSLYGMLI